MAKFVGRKNRKKEAKGWIVDELWRKNKCENVRITIVFSCVFFVNRCMED